MSNYWRGKTALITGGSAGLGKALAEAWLNAGTHVAIAARDQHRLKATTGELAKLGTVLPIQADVTSDSDVSRMIAEVVSRFGQLDVLCNCAGASDRSAIVDTTPAQMRDLMELNLLAVVRTCQAAIPQLTASSGHLVNIGSLASKIASRYMGAYPATKYALAAYTQQLRLELGSQLHVLLACPGPIRRGDGGTRYDSSSAGLPSSATQPGAGAKVGSLPAADVAGRILAACEDRKPELIVPRKVRLLLLAYACSPSLGDWLLKKYT